MKPKVVARLLAIVAAPAVLAGVSLSPTAGYAAYQAGQMQTYVVLYQQQAVPSSAAQTVQQAGGSLVYAYGQIGVVIARSNNVYFRSNMLADNKVDGVSATNNFGVQLKDVQDASGPPPGESRWPTWMAAACRSSSATD